MQHMTRDDADDAQADENCDRPRMSERKRADGFKPSAPGGRRARCEESLLAFCIVSGAAPTAIPVGAGVWRRGHYGSARKGETVMTRNLNIRHCL
jgi:hypothetical protein